MDELDKQLALLASITATSGMLHDSQLLQLKYWILGCTNATKFEFDFDFEKKSLNFNLLEFEGEVPKNQKKMFDLMVLWVRHLLNDTSYKVVIKRKGLIVYPKKRYGRIKHGNKRR